MLKKVAESQKEAKVVTLATLKYLVDVPIGNEEQNGERVERKKQEADPWPIWYLVASPTCKDHMVSFL